MNEGKIKNISHWKILREIGRGASGVVFEAEDALKPAEKTVALKLLNREALLKHYRIEASKTERTEDEVGEHVRLRYEKHIDAFKKEYKKLISLSHPNIAKAYEFGFFEDSFYFCSELVEGETLAQTLRGKKALEMVPYFVQVLEGLDFIHRNGLLHLDIKSENVLVKIENDRPVVKIIDFGVAISSGKYSGSFRGSPSYMAPEIALGWKERVGARADLFSAGVLFYYCLTWGRHPFFRSMAKGDRSRIKEIIENEKLPKPPSSSHAAGFPEFLDTITLRLLAKEPEKRFYSNARAVVNALLTHSPDSFAGIGRNYLLPPADMQIDYEGEREKISRTFEDFSSAIFTISGGKGFGKTHFLNIIRHEAELKSESWNCVHLSLPATEHEVESWSHSLQMKLAENSRGAVILIDNVDQARLCGSGAEERVANIFDNLVSSISERLANPQLFSHTKPLILIYTSTCHSGHDPEPPGHPRLSLRGAQATKQSGAVDFIHLTPFTKSQLKEFLQSTPAFKEKRLPRKWVKELLKRTSGIPAEVVAHLREMDEKSVLFNADGKLIVSSSILREKVPPASTQERLLNEYRSLNPTEKAVVDLVAVWNWKGLTRPITLEDISNFIYTPTLVQNLENLEQKEVLVCHSPSRRHSRESGNPPYTFTNSYCYDLIYETMNRSDRRLIHDQIARYLKSDKDGIALHAGFGSNPVRAAKELISLGKRLLYKEGSSTLAGELFKEAVEISSEKLKPYATILYNQALFYSGKYSSIVIPNGQTPPVILNLIQDPPYWPLRSLLPLIEVLLRTGKIDEARTRIENGLNLSEETDIKPLNLIFKNFLARSFYEESFKNTPEAKKLLSRAKEAYEDVLKEPNLNKFSRRLYFNGDLGVVLRSLGDFKGAMNILTEKLNRVGEENIFVRLETLLTLADICRLTKDFDSAKKFGTNALKLAGKISNARWIVYAYQVLINTFHDSDRFAEAIKVAENCLGAGAALSGKDEYNETSRRLWLKIGHCYKELKNPEKGLQFFETVVEKEPKDIYTMSAHVGLAEIYFETKDTERKEKHIKEAEKLLGTYPEPSHRKRLEELKKT